MYFYDSHRYVNAMQNISSYNSADETYNNGRNVLHINYDIPYDLKFDLQSDLSTDLISDLQSDI